VLKITKKDLTVNTLFIPVKIRRIKIFQNESALALAQNQFSLVAPKI
jgi:hypothetical protein